MKLFTSSNLLHEPLIKINEWIEEAVNLEVPLPHAMNLSTVDDLGQPSSRMVLLKSISDEGMTFYTDYKSQKGQMLEDNPNAALNFWWAKTDKQIRVEGTCSKISSFFTFLEHFLMFYSILGALFSKISFFETIASLILK